MKDEGCGMKEAAQRGLAPGRAAPHSPGGSAPPGCRLPACPHRLLCGVRSALKVGVRSGAFCRAVLRCGYYYYYYLKLQLCCRFALDVQAAVRRRGGIAQPGVPARPQAPEGCSPWVLAHGWVGAGRAPAGSALRDENKSNCSA